MHAFHVASFYGLHGVCALYLYIICNALPENWS